MQETAFESYAIASEVEHSLRAFCTAYLCIKGVQGVDWAVKWQKQYKLVTNFVSENSVPTYMLNLCVTRTLIHLLVVFGRQTAGDAVLIALDMERICMLLWIDRMREVALT
jgi:hypothetical protein